MAQIAKVSSILSLAKIIATVAALATIANKSLAGAGVEDKFLWPSRTIRYAICDCAKGDPKPLCTKFQCVKDAATVKRAIEQWNDSAGASIRLVEKKIDDTKNPYLLYVSQVSETTKATDHKERWCFTEDAGYDKSVGPKLVVIGDDCVTAKKNALVGSILHETGHAVGLRHEQQRTDRDKYLIVKFTGSTANSAISQSGRMCGSAEQAKCEFQSAIFTRIYSYGQDLLKYDFGSVMHYPLEPYVASDPWATAREWKKTCEEGHEDDLKTACLGLAKGGFDRLEEQNLSPKNIGQRKGLSPLDVQSLEKLYQEVPF